MSVITTRRGDTLIEVAFAIATFAMVALISIALMNSGVTMAESSLENTMTRNEIDAQAEAIRFIQNAHLAERELIYSANPNENQQVYRDLWQNLISHALSDASDLDKLNANFTDNAGNISTCSVAYEDNILYDLNAFVVNTRNINPSNVAETIYPIRSHQSQFTTTSLYPRIIFSNGSGQDNADQLSESDNYTKIQRVEGLWVVAVKSDNSTTPEFYDFHIRSCWYASGRETPSTIATIIRLYNPDFGVN